jgi:hypothetical protein
LWGSHRDKHTLKRLRYLFPNTLAELCLNKEFSFREGAQLRHGAEKVNHGVALRQDIEYVPEIQGQKKFNTTLMNQSSLRLSMPNNVLQNIPDEMCYIRKRGGRAGRI